MFGFDLLPSWVPFVVQSVVGVFGMIVVLGTVASTTSFAAWWVRVFDFPRMQLAVLAVGLAVVYAILGLRDGTDYLEWTAVGLMLATGLWQAWQIFPYTPFAKKAVLRAERKRPDSIIKLVVSNVLTSNRAYDTWRAVIEREDADVIAAAETDAAWVDQIDHFFGKSHPHSIKVPLDNLYGLAIWSRLPLSDVSVEYIIQDDIPSFHGTLTLRDGTRLNFHCIHPRPPAPGESDSSAPRDAELVVVGRRVGKWRDEHGTPTLVFGDLNDVAWSRTTELFCKLSRLLDIRKGRGFYSTFSANSRLMRYPLDHIFISPEFRLIDLRVLDHVGSDHFPISVTLAYEPDEQHRQPATAATAEEQQEATERAEAVKDTDG